MSRPPKENPRVGPGVFLAPGCEPLVGSACEKPLRGKQRNTQPSPRAILFRRFALRRRKTAPVLRNGEPYPGKRAGVRTRSWQSRQRAGSRTIRQRGRRPGPHGGRPLNQRNVRRERTQAPRTGRPLVFHTHACGRKTSLPPGDAPALGSSSPKTARFVEESQMADARRFKRRIKERAKRKEAERLRRVELRRILLLSQESREAAKKAKPLQPDARPHQLEDGTWDVSATAGRFRT